MFEFDLPLHLILPAVLLAAFLKGITGLGFSTICLALLANVIDLRIALALILIPSLSSNMIVMVQAGHFIATVKRFRWLYIAAIPGLIIGLGILGQSTPAALAAFLGIVLILYALFALAHPSFMLNTRAATRLAAPAGFITGIINGATDSQVMPALPYLMSLNLHREVLVQASNISFTLGSIIMFAGLTRLGFLDLTTLALSALGVIPVWIGIMVGGWVRIRLPEKWFRTGVLVMLIILGGNLVSALNTA
ncbi:MAG: TSUP family transporter [Gammaproteobacteria bacterium]|nr:TSUP family transporter [Gammaproteobacteria bacterium]